MKWHEFVEKAFHWLTTTRYTRRIEAENQWLLRDNDRLRAENHCLMVALHPQLKNARTEYDVIAESAKPEGQDYKSFKF